MATVQNDTHIKYSRKRLTTAELKALYLDMLRPRLIEEKMLSLLRQGKISKWFSGIGQEAIAVGCTRVLEDDEWIFPMHRNLGVFTTRRVPLDRLFAQWQGKPLGFTKGRDRSFHFGTPEYRIWGMISHLGPQLSLAAGIALGHKLSKQNKLAIAFTGEGGTSEGEFHEALNVAAVWELPVIFVVENNGYGLSTPVSEQFRCASIADKGAGYGMQSYSIDGNNILEVYHKMKRIAADVRKHKKPVLVEFQTFRMRGHEEASGTKYVPQEIMDYWAQRDPLQNYENWLQGEGRIDEDFIDHHTKEIKKEISDALSQAAEAPSLIPSVTEELADVYAPFEQEARHPEGDQKEVRYIDAISDGLNQVLQHFPLTVFMGQDIAEYGGVFKITEGFAERYGKELIRNTPLCESAIVGIALGLSMHGYKAMVEMQFADFVTCGFNQIVNNLAKIHYRWGHAADIVIRMPAGGGVAAGPFHSQTNEAWFAHTPGLKVVYPSSPADAKGLLISAFEDPNPVLFFEHKAMYRTITDKMPEGYYNIPIGKGRYVRRGTAVSIITYGMGVHWAMDVVHELGIDADIVDLRSLQPLDYEIINETVARTGKVLLLHEDSLFGGLGGEVAAYISEHLFEELDGPIVRVGSLDTPIPFAAELEAQYMANSRLGKALEKLLNY